MQILMEKKGKYRAGISADVLQAAAAAGITAGLMGVFFVLGGTSFLVWPIAAAGVLAAIITVLDLRVKGRAYGLIFALSAAALFFFLSVSRVLRGIYVWANVFLGHWNRVFGTFYEEFSVSGSSEADLNYTGLILAFLAAAGISALVRRKSVFFLSLAVFVPLCTGFLLSVRMPAWAAAALIAGWAAAWCCAGGSWIVRWDTIILMVSVWAVFFFLLQANPTMLWQKTAAQFQLGVKQKMEEIRFGKDFLPQGDLLKANTMLDGQGARLELEMQDVFPVYLRGFIGSEYTKSGWRTFPAERYQGEFSGMLSWLERQGFYPGAQYGAYREADAEENPAENTSQGMEKDKDKEEKQVLVKNIGANRRYIYLPETMASCSEDAGKWKQDWSMEASGWFGKKDYAFTTYDVQSNAEVQTPAAWVYQNTGAAENVRNFRAAERVYRSFVYENYLDIDDEEKELIESVFFHGEGEEKAEGVYTVTSRIRAVLRILAEYKEAPPGVPANRDFLDWFIDEGKEGNAAYFASAAVLAYRAAGIPARYVEGYALTRPQAGRVNGNTVTLTGKNAHAWAEVYVDGIGWRAMEVTPGFYEELYQANIVVAVPNEELEGAGDGDSGILTSEEFEYPDSEEESSASMDEKRTGIGILLFLGSVSVILLAGIAVMVYFLYRYCCYRKMSGERKMTVLYFWIMRMLEKMYHGFNIEHPFTLREQGEVFLDIELYERTVRRVERMVYGEKAPEDKEIFAAEALTVQVWKAFRKMFGWRAVFSVFRAAFAGERQ